MMNAQEVREKTDLVDLVGKTVKLKKVGSEYFGLCLFHDDKTPSLAVNPDKKVWYCHGCNATGDCFDWIQRTQNVDFKEALRILGGDSATEPNRIVATYDYKDECGDLLFQVVRMDPKSFRQRRKDSSGEWVWNLEGVRRVLYKLPEVLETFDRPIYLVEGEKDVERLFNYGLCTTTSPGGANNWKPEYADCLKGKKVVIVPDKDTAGFAYARDVALSLEGKAKEVKVIILPGDKVKDISDWFEAGGDYEQLPTLEQPVSVLFEQDKPQYQILNDAIYWTKPVKDHSLSFRAEKLTDERTGAHARISISCDHQMLAWSYFNIERAEERTRLANSAHQQIKGDFSKEFTKEDLRRHLDTYCAGLYEANNARYLPSMMSGDDTQEPLKFFLYPYVIEGGGTILFAPPGRGKSYTALLWAVSVDAGITKFWKVTKTPTLFINLERSRQSLRRRLAAVNKALGLPADRELLTLNGRGKSLSQVIAALRRSITEHHVKFVVLDSISRAGFGDLNENKPVNAIVDALSGLCDTWLALGHTSRASEDHLYGSIMMDAGADIVVQLNSETKPDGTLGIGWQITKKNDLPAISQEIKALEFDQYGLYLVREPLEYEFPEIEGKTKIPMIQAIIDFITDQDTGDATATEIAAATRFSRENVSKTLNKSGKFLRTRTVKQSVYYGVKDNTNE